MPRSYRSGWGRIVSALIVLIVLALRWWNDQGAGNQDVATGPPSQQSGLPPGEYEVVRVVDGDTLIIGPRKTRVRLQGVDTPETVKQDTPVQPWGPEATSYTEQFVSDAGRSVRVEIDGESSDQYGRRLAFIWNGQRMLNEELVRNGLADAKLGYNYSQAKKDVLKRAKREAQRAKRGIWSGD